jgi:serine O-acetyltransferase
VFEAVRDDLAAVRERDPAFKSNLEVVLTYPGIHAVWGHRLAHVLWLRHWSLAARFVSNLTRALTGVDIHPGATIGPGLFIDHAVGVVIGETAVVGRDVTIYQGVTLGGTSLEAIKRHPTVGDRVTVGAGAKLLGAIEIGHDSRIGANAVVVRDVPPNSVVVGIPGQVIARSRPRTEASPPDLDEGIMPDLVGVSLSGLRQRVDELEQKVVGHITVPDVQPSESGIWSGQDFSI